MSPEHITNEVCRELRLKIYEMIFPRWILMSIGGAFILSMILLYASTGRNVIAAADAMKKAENNETKFTLHVEHLKEGQVRIGKQLTAQHKLLTGIHKKVNGE